MKHASLLGFSISDCHRIQQVRVLRVISEGILLCHLENVTIVCRFDMVKLSTDIFGVLFTPSSRPYLSAVYGISRTQVIVEENYGDPRRMYWLL